MRRTPLQTDLSRHMSRRVRNGDASPLLEYLQRGRTDWSPHPRNIKYRLIRSSLVPELEVMQIEELVYDSPLMTNPEGGERASLILGLV